MILLLTNADTELLAVRTILHRLPEGFPAVRAANPHHLPWAGAPQASVPTSGPSDRTSDTPALAAGYLDGASAVLVRLLGGRSSWEKPFDAVRAACQAAQVPFIALGGEAEPDPEMAERSSVPSGLATELHRYFAAGGPQNLEHALRFVADTVLLTGFGFDPPSPVPMAGVWAGAVDQDSGYANSRQEAKTRNQNRRLVVAVIFYRAHLLAGNTQFVADLCRELEAAGADALPIYCYSLRPDADGRSAALDLCREHSVDALITCVRAMGSPVRDAGSPIRVSGSPAQIPGSPASTGSDDSGWDASLLAELDVPVLQAPTSNRPRSEWAADEAGLTPLDAAAGVAIPELDGRIIGPAFAFKEQVDDGGELGTPVTALRTDPERTRRVASLAVRMARLRHTHAAAKRVAVVLSAYPTKQSRLGNAVGLDTPASAIRLLHALKDAGYQVTSVPESGDALMATLAEGLTYDQPQLPPSQAARAPGRLPTAGYREWFGTLPDEARQQLESVWGPPPGDVYLDPGNGHELVFPGLELGNVLVTIQPPRAFGSDPIGAYHAPDVPPPHHYLAFYRWLDTVWGADAIVHLGKHGTLEWLPGKANAPSAACFPDSALGDVPFVYPFVVNDPGEGTQAKRRTHGIIVDHLVPPLTRADTYDDLARLEQLLDAYAQAQAMDPAKLPALRRQVWELLVEAEIHRDLGVSTEPGEDEFDHMVLHVDGYLCALKDAQIRGGLHVLGQPPEDEALIDLVLAVTRLPQGQVGSLRQAVAEELGVTLDPGGGDGQRADVAPRRADVDRVEAECRRRVEALASRNWDRNGPIGAVSVQVSDVVEEIEEWLCGTLVPALRQTTDEIGNLLAALEGRYVPAGPSGAPSRGAAHVLPTGRNFYSVDPRAVPSALSWEVGRQLADAVVERHVAETGEPPRTVGLVLWGTAAMRTGGDDAAQALALLGVRPVWEPESGRVTGLEAIPLAELGRPRVDVTLRISGFFRDAFPHLVGLLDEAVALVAGLDEPRDQNPVRQAGASDPRIWGPPPGGYGSGILPVLEQGSWRSDADLAEVYLAWSGFAYGRDRFGRAEPEAMRRRFAAIEVAIKNQDNREHDIFDSDDYLQDHGGMVAAVRSLTGSAPKAWFGDTADPAAPKVRTLAQEAARVVRSRVLNPRWIGAMRQHGYKGAFELAATVDYLFGYDATTHVVEDWMYERVTQAYVADPELRAFFKESNPWALRAIAERLLEADRRGMWEASEAARKTLVDAVLEAEGWEEAGSPNQAGSPS